MLCCHLVLWESLPPSLLLQVALGLYQLEHMEMFWERGHDTHALLAWGPSNIVLTFRGTASLKNVLADLQVLLVCSAAQ